MSALGRIGLPGPLRKLLPLLLALGISLSFGAVVGAGGVATSVEVGSAEGQPGTTVEIPVEMDPNLTHIFWKYSIAINYDATVLEPAGDQATDDASSQTFEKNTGTPGTITMNASKFGLIEYVTEKQKMFTLHFKIKEGASLGDTSITISSASITMGTDDITPVTNITAGKVTVKPIKVTDVSLDKAALNLSAGGTDGQLQATVLPANATNKKVLWTSDDKSVATVSEDGRVTPVSNGTATIVATTEEGGKTAQATVTVSTPSVTVAIGEQSGNAGQTVEVPVTVAQASAGVGSYGMQIGFDQAALEVTGITGPDSDHFSSIHDNAAGWLKAAWVDASGGDKAILAGETLFTIAFKIKDNAAAGEKALGVSSLTDVEHFTLTDQLAAEMTKTLTAGKVTVGAVSVTSVALDKNVLYLLAGGVPGTLSATVSPAHATNQSVTWTTSDATVATVTYGVVTPVAPGTAMITATTVDGGKSATAIVNVTDTAVPVTGVALDKHTLHLVAGGASDTLTATVSPYDATNQYVVWTTSDATVATVTYGVVTPVAPGTATITVTTDDGKFTASAAVNVATALLEPLAPGLLTATAGDGHIALQWSPSVGATAYKIFQSLSAGVHAEQAITVSGSVYRYTAYGLTNGTKYYFTVKAANAAGASDASNEVSAIPFASPAGGEEDDGGENQAPPVSNPSAGPGAGSSVGSSAPNAPERTGVEVLVNGRAETAGTAQRTTMNGQSVTTITVDSQKLEERLAAAGRHAVITIPVGSDSDKIVGVLTGQMIKNMESQQAVVELKSSQASYTLPAQQINIDAISARLGTSVKLEDILVQIEISKPAASMINIAENAAVRERFALVVPPLEFRVSVTYGNTTVEVSKFDAYVERTIAIPDDVDPNRITTAVVVQPDGTVRHVPTKVQQTNGRYYAVINSLTNSLYSVIWHPLEFGDMAGHWAKDAVNNMGSRMVIEGTGGGSFSPDRDITRAEFAAIIVRGLGLEGQSGASVFSDVKPTDWYNGAVNTAYAYGLISGFGDGSFRPNERITREQAMIMLAKSMIVTGLNTGLGSDLNSGLKQDAAADVLSRFSDSADVSPWAKASIADSIAAGLVSGREDAQLSPQAFMTRAEVAAMIERLLQKSGLI